MAGQPMPPEAAPAAEGAPDQMQEFVSNLSKGLGVLAENVAEARPDIAQALSQLNDQFQQIVMELAGGEGAPAQGVTSPEAGASGAVPASPAGVR